MDVKHSFFIRIAVTFELIMLFVCPWIFRNYRKILIQFIFDKRLPLSPFGRNWQLRVMGQTYTKTNIATTRLNTGDTESFDVCSY